MSPHPGKPARTAFGAYLAAHGWTTARLAQRLGCSARTVEGWRSGRKVPSLAWREKIGRVLRIALAEVEAMMATPAA